MHHILADESYVDKGIQIVTDMRSVRLSHIFSMGLSGARLIAEISFASLPFNVKKIHIVYANRLTDLAIRTFLPFLKKKIANRIMLHDKKSLTEYCSLSSLAPFLGGGTETYSLKKSGTIVKESRAAWKPMWMQIQNNNNEP